MMTRNEMPAGAVRLRSMDDDAREAFEPRTGAERVTQLTDDNGKPVEVFAIWPANRNGKGVPEHGPFEGSDERGRKWVYYTHTLPDKDGVFCPARYDVYPPDLAALIDEKAERMAKLPANLRGLIDAHRAAR